MRWKLLRRRLSVSAPRVIVRSHLPWPLRWAVVAASLGFSAALALWAFEFGKEIAGLDRSSRQELAHLREEVAALREANARARAVADSAESLLKAEKVAQEQLGVQLRRLEADKLALQADLGFFEGLMPLAGQGVQIRGLQLDAGAPGALHYQLLLMQPGRPSSDFSGRWELLLQGAREGRSWTATHPGDRLLQFRQYLRLEGSVAVPPGAVIKTARARVYDAQGGLRAELSARP
ncbi:MAG: hypothetical protein AMXMBFR78_06230 [Rubrivivax sp.]|jgi:hypothetical protein|nr:hypothetical protein [Rubrivivax sp.]